MESSRNWDAANRAIDAFCDGHRWEGWSMRIYGSHPRLGCKYTDVTSDWGPCEDPKMVQVLTSSALDIALKHRRLQVYVRKDSRHKGRVLASTSSTEAN